MTARAWLAVLLLGSLACPAGAEEPVTGVAKMRDAVTVAIGGARFRLEGIEPPASDAVCEGRQCLDAAMNELERFISGRQVTCTKSRRLGHGFFLSSCRLEDGVDAAEHLLGRGLAEPGAGADAAHRAAAEQAKAAGRGMWAGS